MSKLTLAQALYRQLSHECELAMSLVDVLLEEQGCLIKLETDKLHELAVSKEGMMLELEQHYKKNIAHAKKYGFDANMDGLNLWAQSLHKLEPKLPGTCLTLRNTLEQAHRLNNTNGNIVAEQLQGLQQRIAILTAAAVEQLPSAADTYGAKGLMNGPNGSGSRAIF